jgi:hypothetical protein
MIEWQLVDRRRCESVEVFNKICASGIVREVWGHALGENQTFSWIISEAV